MDGGWWMIDEVGGVDVDVSGRYKRMRGPKWDGLLGGGTYLLPTY